MSLRMYYLFGLSLLAGSMEETFLNILVVFDLHLDADDPGCNLTNREAIRHVTVLNYAIFKANQNHSDNGVTVTTHVIDTCGDVDRTLEKLQNYFATKSHEQNGNANRTAILINSKKHITSAVSSLALLFSIPVVNVAQIVESDDVDPSASTSSVLNMAPSRYVLADAVTAFLKQTDVPYVQSVSSKTPYHRRFVEILNERTSMRDCCVVTQFEVSQNLTKEELDRILDGLLREARFSPGTVMLTTEEDFVYLMEELAKRRVPFGPLFIGLNRPPQSWIGRFHQALTGATFLQSINPANINMTEFKEFAQSSPELREVFISKISDDQDLPIACTEKVTDECYDTLFSGTSLTTDFVSSYIMAGVKILVDGATASVHSPNVCSVDKSCVQNTFFSIITNAGECTDNFTCNGVSYTTASSFDVYSVSLRLKIVEAGSISGIHSHVEWPATTHLNSYWQIMNRVRLGFRAECRTKVRNKYAMLNTDSADAYIIGVLHNHRDQTSPSGCDENGVHREHTLRTSAILYAVDKINERKDILPNITLGAIVIDSCYITDKIVQQVVDIVNGHVKVKNRFGLLSVPIGMVGTSSSSRTAAVAPTIQSYNIPIVSFSASSPLLSNKYNFPLFFRPIASDVKQALAMVSLLKHYGWSYIGCVYSSSDYGKYGIREVIQQAKYNGMKVAYQIQLDNSFVYDEKSLDHVFKTFIVNRMDKVRVIAAFLETRHAEEIFKSAERHDVKGLIWIGSDSFTDSDTAAKSKYALGSIGVVFHTGILDEFGQFIASINARNYSRDPFYLDLVESKLNCYLHEENKQRFPEPCPEDARLVYSEISSGGESSPTIDCVLSLAHGLDFLLKRHCSLGELCTDAKKNIRDIPSVMTEVIFKGSSGDMIMFDSKGDGVGRYDFINLRPPDQGEENEYFKFATWDTGKLTFSSSPLAMDVNGTMVPMEYISADCDGTTCSSTSANIVGMEYAYKRGKLLLHAFFPVHYYDSAVGTCSTRVDHSGFEAVVAALWAVKILNEQDFLSGLKLGIAVYDTCSSPIRAQQLVHEVVRSTFLVPRPPESPQEDKLIGLIGSTRDDETLAMESERQADTSPTKAPLISMTSSILPDELANDETFYRTVPPTDAEILLIIQLMKKLGWDYIHLVYTASLANNETVKRFVADAIEDGVCVATKVALHTSWSNLDNYVKAVYHMLNVSGASVVVMMSGDETTQMLLRAAKQVKAHGKLFWIATESWRNKPWMAELQDIAIGALTISPNQTVNTDFGKYFNSLSIVNGSDIAWFQEYWQSHFQCNLARGDIFEKTCTADLKLNSSGEYEQSWEAPAAINAVFAFAHAVKSISDQCNTKDIVCNTSLFEYLDHQVLVRELPKVNFAPPGGVNFFFRERSGQGSFEIFNVQPHRGSYRFTRVGRYNNGGLSLSMHHTGMYRDGKRLIPESKCPGQCKVCLTDKFLEEYDAKVASLEAAGPPLKHHLNRAIGIVMISLLCLGIGFTLLLIFYLFKLIASRKMFIELSIDASITLIIGVLVLYLTNITFLFSATNATCGVRRICLGLAYCICFSAQLIDVARLGVITQLKSDTSYKDVLQARRVHIYIPVLLAGQIVPTIFWLLLEPSGALLDVPMPQDVASLDEVLPTWRCKIDRYELVCSLGYDAVLLLHTMILAVIHRGVKTESGVRPARHILLSTIVTTSIWIAWIPLYLHLESNDGYLALVSVGISLDATFMLGINFMPKVVTLMATFGDYPYTGTTITIHPEPVYERFKNEEPVVDKTANNISSVRVRPKPKESNFNKNASSISGVVRMSVDKPRSERRRPFFIRAKSGDSHGAVTARKNGMNPEADAT